MNKPFRVCLLPVLLAFWICARQGKEDEKKRSAANEGLKKQIDAWTAGSGRPKAKHWRGQKGMSAFCLIPGGINF